MATRRGWGKIRQLPSGNLQASYVGPDLQRHVAASTFTARMDAEHWLSNERRSIEREEWIPPRQRVQEKVAKRTTVAEYTKQWIAHRNVKPRTRIGYEALLANHIEDSIGRAPVATMTPETVRVWFAGLGKDHPTRNGHAYGLLHAVMETAVTDGLLASNPCRISGATNVARKRDPVILSVSEVAALADAIRPERLKCLVLLSAWIGTRWGETSELRRKDVSNDCSIITVSRAVTRRGGEYRVDTPKSKRGRTVVVPPHIRDDLKQHLESIPKDPEALLFPAARGGHMNDRVFSREYFADALKAIGREKVRVHDLRHFAGTQTARVGNLVETMQRLGHSTMKASVGYQAAVSGRDAEIAVALSKLAEDRESRADEPELPAQ